MGIPTRNRARWNANHGHARGDVMQHHGVGANSRVGPDRYPTDNFCASADEYPITKDGRTTPILANDNAALYSNVATAAHASVDDHTYGMNNYEPWTEVRSQPDHTAVDPFVEKLKHVCKWLQP
jgi:hypothetical protein